VASNRPMYILLVEPDLAEARRLIGMLRERGTKFRLHRAPRLVEAKRHLWTKGADVALIDLSLPDAQGLAVVLEAQQAAPGVPLVALSGEADDSLAAQALQLGVQDVLVKSELNPVQLARALCYAIARQRAQAKLHSLSVIDELTGLHNRRGFIASAEQRLKLALRQGQHSTLVFIDVDDLKYVNDTFGHGAGDHALKQVARLLRECFRESDVVARMGGDEFCAFLSDTSENSELLIQRRLAQLFEKHNAGSKSPYRLLVSVGTVEVHGPYDLEQQIARADVLMYEQKRAKQGRGERFSRLKEHRLV
jgi:two-component system, cell cycle response regulator